MNHHNALEKFASRGLKAQAAVDEVIKGGAHGAAATTISPAGGSAGAAEAGAGRSDNTAPRSRQTGGSARPAGADMLERIKLSSDVRWLKSVLSSQEYQLAIRQAAQRRLGALVRKPKL